MLKTRKPNARSYPTDHIAEITRLCGSFVETEANGKPISRIWDPLRMKNPLIDNEHDCLIRNRLKTSSISEAI